MARSLVEKRIKSGTDLSNAIIDGIVDLSNGIKVFEDKTETPVPD